MGVPAMTRESPIAQGASERLERTIVGGVDALGTAVDKTSMALGDLADSAKDVGKSFGRAWNAQGLWMRAQTYRPALQAAAEKYGIDAGVLSGIARVESGYDPNAVNAKSGARGIMQLNPKFFPNAGKSPYADIDTAARHFAGLLEGFEGSEQERYISALRAYNAGETNYRTNKNLGPENRAYAGKVLAGTGMALPTPGMQGGSVTNQTDVTFENVTINTPRTDGAAVADEFVESTRRKMMTAQADSGLQ
jgi:hypothetical protein